MPELQQDFSEQERLRLIEAKYTLMRDRLLIINQNMIDQYKRMNKEISLLREEIKDIKKTSYDLKEIIEHLVSEMRFFAKIEHVKVIEKYINFWNPLNFTTEKDVRRIIEENATKKRSGKHNRRIVKV